MAEETGLLFDFTGTVRRPDFTMCMMRVLQVVDGDGKPLQSEGFPLLHLDDRRLIYSLLSKAASRVF